MKGIRLLFQTLLFHELIESKLALYKIEILLSFSQDRIIGYHPEQIGVARRRGRRSQKLLDDLKEKRGYWKLKEEVLDCIVWRTGLGRVYGMIIRQTAE
jgi:hypothetical protein